MAESSVSPSMLEIEEVPAPVGSRANEAKAAPQIQEEQPVSIEDLSESELATEPLETVLNSTAKDAPEPFVESRLCLVPRDVRNTKRGLGGGNS